VTAIAGHELKSVQTFGTQDPFVEIQCCGMKKKTKTHFDGGTDPKWDDPGHVFDLTQSMLASSDLWVVIKDHGSFGSHSQIGWTQIPLVGFVTPHEEQAKFPVTTDGALHGTIELKIASVRTDGSGAPLAGGRRRSADAGKVTSALQGAMAHAGSMGFGLTHAAASADGSGDDDDDDDEDEVEDYGYCFVESLPKERHFWDCGSPWKLRYLHLYNSENLRVYEFKDDIRTKCKPQRAYVFYSGSVERGVQPGAPYPYVLKVNFRSRVGNKDVGDITFSCTTERQMEAWYTALHDCFDAAPIVRADV